MKKIVGLTILWFSLCLTSTIHGQDFHIDINIDSVKDPLNIKLYQITSYNNIRTLRVQDMIASGYKIDSTKWMLTGKLNDSTTLYRVHMHKGTRKDIHVYKSWVIFLSLKKGDSVSIDLQDYKNFKSYEVKGPVVNKSLRNAFRADRKLIDLITNTNNEDVNVVNDAKNKLKDFLDERKTLLDTVTHSDVYFVLLQPLVANQLDHLDFFSREKSFLSKVNEEFKTSLFAKQITKDLSKISKTRSRSWVYLGVIIIVVLILLTRILPKVIHEKKKARIDKLTTNEKLIFELIAKNKSNQEIADQRYTQVSTVKKHINSVYRKLKVNNRKEAIAFYKKYNY